jgi:hypothetical protein
MNYVGCIVYMCYLFFLPAILTMQQYSSLDQEISNITWFVLGEDDFIIEFSSGGHVLPEIIANRAEENEILVRYFNALPATSEVELSPDLNTYYDLNRLRGPVAGLGYYAAKGLISFNTMDNLNDIDYFLVALPVKKLELAELPEHIQALLLPTRQKIRFQDFYKLDAGYRPWACLFSGFHVEPTFDKNAHRKKKWFNLW